MIFSLSTYSLLRVIDLCYEQWVTLEQHIIYPCTQSDSQVYKLIILIITIQC